MHPERPELERAGGCLCGAVRFTAHLNNTNFGVCHCEMCRKWTGSALLAITVPEANVAWTGADRIAKRQSSFRGERAWCADCGSPIWFRVTVDGPHAGNLELPVGLFHDANGLTLTGEHFLDQKPDSFAFADRGQSPRIQPDRLASRSLLAGV